MRKRLTYANVMVTLAVVFAMTGGAYAAGKYVISSTKQINPKVLKSLVGKNGISGAPGPAGPQGPAGAAGVKGETGAAGQNGALGEKGAQGEKGAAGTNGFNGTNGAKGPAGPTGPTGATGSPWTAGGTLPVGSSETGQWSFAINQATGTPSPWVTASISFPIRLENTVDHEHSHFIGPEEAQGEAKFEAGEDIPEVKEAFEKKECSGNVKEPKAASGNLCVFANPTYDFAGGPHMVQFSNGTIRDAEAGGLSAEETGRSGAWLTFEVGASSETKEGDFITGSGDWVVTG